MTFTDDLNDLIRLNRGDTKRLRNIKDVIKHDNFITVIDKKYVESLVTTYLKNQPIDESEVTTALAPTKTDSPSFTCFPIYAPP